jgi:hypothetical protein
MRGKSKLPSFLKAFQAYLGLDTPQMAIALAIFGVLLTIVWMSGLWSDDIHNPLEVTKEYEACIQADSKVDCRSAKARRAALQFRKLLRQEPKMALYVVRNMKLLLIFQYLERCNPGDDSFNYSLDIMTHVLNHKQAKEEFREDNEGKDYQEAIEISMDVLGRLAETPAPRTKSESWTMSVYKVIMVVGLLSSMKDDTKVMVSELGGIENILKCLQKYADTTESVSKWCNWALAILLDGFLPNMTDFVEFGGIEIVLTSLCVHRKSLECTQQGLVVLYHVLMDTASHLKESPHGFDSPNIVYNVVESRRIALSCGIVDYIRKAQTLHEGVEYVTDITGALLNVLASTATQQM